MITPQPDPLIGVGMAMALAVAAVFGIAALTKATSPSATASELSRLGVPLPRIAARVLPLAEFAIAGLLVVATPIGAVVALVALGAFTVFVLRAVRAGSAVSCACLGSFSRAAISPATVARNGVLLAMTATALAVPEPVVPDLASTLAAVSMVLAAAVVVQLVALRNRIGRVWSVALAGEQQTSNNTRKLT